MPDGDGPGGVRDRLATNLVEESEAYGFSLTTWGVGVLAVNRFGLPGVVGVSAYVGGAVVGFGLLAVVAFDQFFGEAEVSDGSLFVASVVHIISTLGTVLASQGVLRVLTPYLPEPAVFFCLGVLLATLYNALLTTEQYVERQFA